MTVALPASSIALLVAGGLEVRLLAADKTQEPGEWRNDDMDDRQGTSAIRAVMAAAGGLLLLLVLPARAAFGDAGVQAVLLVALVVVALFAYEQLTGRRLPRPALLSASTAAPAVAPVEDVWRSERWIREAVQRGLRALDEWRLEQREV